MRISIINRDRRPWFVSGVLGASLLLSACSAPRSKAVVVAYPSGTASLVPEEVASEEIAASILSNVFEPLVSFEGNLALQPGLAESWYTEDQLTWVFKLRRGVRFQDGRELDAHAVAQNIDRARTDAQSKVRGELAAIESVSARDPITLVVRTRTPFATLPPRLESVPVWMAPQGGGPLVGTGPFRVHTWTPRGDTTLEAFDGYARGAPIVKRLEFRVIPSIDDRLSALVRGDVDVVPEVPPEKLPSLVGSRNVRIATLKGLRVIFLGMDCARTRNPYVSTPTNPLHDPRVRRAVSLALDRNALVKEALSGHAEVIEQLVAPGVFGYNRSLVPYEVDLAQSRRLLAEAGFPKGFAVDLDFMPKKYLSMPRVMDTLVKQLAKVDIEIRPRPLEAENFFARIERRDTAMYLMGWIATSGDAGISYGYLVHSPFGGLGSENGTGYSSEKVDGLIERSTGELNVQDRAALLWEIASVVHDEAPMIPLYRQEDIYGLNARLSFAPPLSRMIHGASMTWGPR